LSLLRLQHPAPPTSPLLPCTAPFRSGERDGLAVRPEQLEGDQAARVIGAGQGRRVVHRSDPHLHIRYVVLRGEVLVELRGWAARSEEHTSELQSRVELVCGLLL